MTEVENRDEGKWREGTAAVTSTSTTPRHHAGGTPRSPRRDAVCAEGHQQRRREARWDSSFAAPSELWTADRLVPNTALHPPQNPLMPDLPPFPEDSRPTVSTIGDGGPPMNDAPSFGPRPFFASLHPDGGAPGAVLSPVLDTCLALHTPRPNSKERPLSSAGAMSARSKTHAGSPDLFRRGSTNWPRLPGRRTGVVPRRAPDRGPRIGC
jgi:hypothetical protein